ncbi:Uncharacterized protein OBRU01_14844, partial [Operophtera brumata]
MSSSLVFNPVRLIDEIKVRPGLYAERSDRTERLDLWKEVGAALFPDWGECNKSTVYGRVLQIQKKWKSLRDAYNRELRFRKMTTKRSRIVYRYFKRIASMDGQDLNYTQEIEDDMDTPTPLKEETIEELPVLKKLKKIKKKRRKRDRSTEEIHPIEEAEEMEMPMFPMEFSGETENDSDRLFLLSFVPEMRQLPVHIKMWARAQIANIMQEAVSSQYNNSKPGRSTEN